ncbi:MAG TPA: phosphoenolpyruvate hydrolase family protein [Flexilinea sp.]|mgnify:CR=1 FL=1|jgi:predicted TIM-barrel enzyme|nr:phosphoenolpyruvate hydrolase family protein [Flexilinea sp.]HPR70528.1 phosphoenolpyruvate hydrolase family protein [Flexilinea sp.]HQF80017.1 phosphoenolpyruvate hydrolase family protein [Flexilinea sp.]HQG88788.1 phosphoenolpyruvate hydrolase family protein [Flexilinea sp.]HQJ01795.1 phosphoenolpyruvate hydrolase family protein [Flexilinea sp.]
MAISRSEILKKFYEKAEAGIPIVGGGAGTGISAKFEEAGGIDLLVIYNSGRYRMAGRVSITGLFAYGDANQIMLDMAKEVLPVVKHTPVLAGVNGTDPFRLMPVLLEEVKRMGFSGVQNFPTVGLFDGRMRANMEATGLGYDKEVEMIRLAHEMDLLTTPYVFTEDEAKAMTKAGADLIVAHCGLTTGGSIGAYEAMTLDEGIEFTMKIADAVRSVRKDALVICHGGPFDEPENVALAMEKMPGINGFYGATSMERLPVERSIKEQVEKFCSMKVHPFHAK